MENKLWIYSFPELYRVVGDMQIVMIFVIIADALELTRYRFTLRD